MYTLVDISRSLKWIYQALWSQQWLRGQGAQKGWHRPARLLLEGLQHSIPNLDKVALVPRHLTPHIQQVSCSIHLQSAEIVNSR